VSSLAVSLFSLSYIFTAQSEVDATLVVQTIPRDDLGSSQWGIGVIQGGPHVITNAPIMVCVGGAIHTRGMTGPDWRTPFSLWGENIQSIERESLIAHSSGLSFDGKAQFAWSTQSAKSRYNVLFQRPSVPQVSAAAQPLIIEPDRQWFNSDYKDPGHNLDAEKSLADLRSHFRKLDDLLRTSAQSGKTDWVSLALRNPDGPPQFDWLVSPGSAVSPNLRIRRGEMLFALSDQSLGKKDVIPRSIATVDGDVSIVRGSTVDTFRLKFNAAREISVVSVLPDNAKLAAWGGRLLFDIDPFDSSRGRLRWLPGRMMTKVEATQLRLDFAGFDPDNKPVEK
ncbi:MAG: hypothetical protein WCK15_25465, partial [Pirellula sp.]